MRFAFACARLFKAEVVLAGGCETFSDVPIRFQKPIRTKLLGLAKVG
jgi:acetyl-CoA acyltransferase